MISIHTAWGAPVFIIAILALLYMEIQWAAFVGLGAMLLLIPASAYVGKTLGTLRRKIVGFTDKRTSYMNEIINGIRVIKFYAWELPFRCARLSLPGPGVPFVSVLVQYQQNSPSALKYSTQLYLIPAFSAAVSLAHASTACPTCA